MKDQKTKIKEWEEFSKRMNEHIQDYVLPQYGDHPDEHIESMSLEQIKGKMSSYVQRMGKVQIHRGIEGARQDMLKIAHFCCYAITKLSKES